MIIIIITITIIIIIIIIIIKLLLPQQKEKLNDINMINNQTRNLPVYIFYCNKRFKFVKNMNC